MKNEKKLLQLNEAKWNEWAKSLDNKSWRNDYLRNAQGGVLSLLSFKKDVHFLDVGCGTGWAVGEAAKLANYDGVFYGVDLSPKMMEKAKSNFNGRDNFHFLQSNAESIPLEDDFFDIIICTNSFHHYPNPNKALSEMYRLLKKGGKVYVLDPTADTWIIRLADKIIKLAEPEHVKIYSTREFQQLFDRAGLKYSASIAVDRHQVIHIGEK